MKNFILACFLISIPAGYIQAQQITLDKDQVKQSGHYKPTTPEERASRQTKIMTQSLNLNPDQEARVQALNLKRIAQMEELRESKKNNNLPGEAGAGKNARDIRNTYASELKAILTPEQYIQYEAQQTEMRNRRREMLPPGTLPQTN